MTAPEIPSFFDPAVQDDPFEAYEMMHAQCPVHQLPENGLFMVCLLYTSPSPRDS